MVFTAQCRNLSKKGRLRRYFSALYFHKAPIYYIWELPKKGWETMPSELDGKILAAFKQLTEENQLATFDFLASILSGPAEAFSDRQ